MIQKRLSSLFLRDAAGAKSWRPPSLLVSLCVVAMDVAIGIKRLIVSWRGERDNAICSRWWKIVSVWLAIILYVLLTHMWYE